jgi:ABC-type glycerol-3-phosphate transport system substrate-binding protein
LESQAIEPISLILAALAAGAAAAAKDTAATADYEGLKALIKKKFAEQGKADSSTILDKYEQKPEKTKALLEDELEEAGLKELKEDDEIIKAAQEVMKKEEPEGTKEGKYNINISGGVQNVVGSNRGTASQTVTYNPKSS